MRSRSAEVGRDGGVRRRRDGFAAGGETLRTRFRGKGGKKLYIHIYINETYTFHKQSPPRNESPGVGGPLLEKKVQPVKRHRRRW